MEKDLESRINKSSSSFNVANGKSKDSIWKDIEAATTEKTPVFKIKPIWFSAAASLAVLFTITYSMFFDGSIIIDTSVAEHDFIELPCGSTVMINAMTTVDYNERDWNEARTFNLDGEAYFNVSKGSSFIINTPKGKISVLGTAFNVNTYDDNFSVQCDHGKVQVEHQGKGFVITNKEMVELYKGKLTAPHTTRNIGDWQSGEFHFSDESVQNVFASIERSFPYHIHYTGQHSFTGVFTTNSIDEAMQIICDPLNLHFEIKENDIYVKPNK